MKNLSTILPFYEAIGEQYRYREDVESQPCLVALNTTFLPFCIRRTHSGGTTSNLTLLFYDLEGNLKDTVAGTVCSITSGSSYDYIIYDSGLLSPTLTTGSRYLVVKDDYPDPDKLWYSETFTVLTSVSTYLKLQFSNVYQHGNIPANFSQTLYINNTLKTPEYIREDTGDKRDGILIPEKQVLMKSYKFRVMMAAEYLVDALMMLPLMDTVILTTPAGDVLTFDEVRIPDPEWIEESYGSRAKIEVQLIRDIVIKKLSYKETGISTNTMDAYIETGVGATTADGNSFSLTVTFDPDMPDTNYKPDAFAVDSYLNVQLATFTDLNVNGMKIWTPVACTVRWSAIHE